MIKFDIKTDVSTSLANLKRAQKAVNQLPQQAYDYLKGITPIDSGNARRSTQLKGKTIEGNYAYAQRLDQGYSKQAPKGMTEPTKKFVDKRIKQIEAGR
jgi:hypothetical protein